MNLNYQYGYAQDWDKWPNYAESIKDISENQEYVSFYRKKVSHKGISAFLSIKYLIANQVNSDFLSEISKLINLEYLNLEVVTAENLSALSKLEKLKTLKIYGVQKANDFSKLLDIVSLQNLFIENAKHLYSLEVFSEAPSYKSTWGRGQYVHKSED